MPANGGLVTSFLDAFMGLQQMERQKRHDEVQQAQQAVDSVLRQEEIKLRETGLRQQENRSQENLDFRRDVEERRANDSHDRQRDRSIRQGLAQQRLEQSGQRLTSEQMSKVLTAGENVFRELVAGGVSAEEARAYAEDHKSQLAAQMGVQIQQPANPAAQPFGGQVEQGPLTLSGAAPQGAGAGGGPTLGVLPKVAQSIKSLLVGDDVKAAQKNLVEARTDLLHQTMADRASEKATRQAYEKNKVKLQEVRLQLAPLEATAKRLGIQTEKLRQQKLAGEIEFQPIHEAIERLKLNKEKNSSKWSEDAKFTRQWLTKEYDASRMAVSNALSHLTPLKEKNRIDDSKIMYYEGLIRQKKAKAEDYADLDALRASRLDRAASIGFYQGEYDRSFKQRDGFKGQLDSLLGIGSTPVTSRGTIDRKALLPAVPGQSLNTTIKVKTPREAQNLPKGTRYVTPDGRTFVR